MSILKDDIMSIGACLAGERFEIIVNGMNVPQYNRIKEREGLKRTSDEVRRLFWRHENSIDIIKEKVENFPICDRPIRMMLNWLEITIMQEIKSNKGHTNKRIPDNAVFAMLDVGGTYLRMLSICIKEK